MGGRKYGIYVLVPDFYRVVAEGPAWMNVTINRDRRALMAAVDGRGEFAFHTQLRANEEESRVTLGDAEAMIQAAIGASVDLEILSRGTWTAGHPLAADQLQHGRGFLAG